MEVLELASGRVLFWYGGGAGFFLRILRPGRASNSDTRALQGLGWVCTRQERGAAGPPIRAAAPRARLACRLCPGGSCGTLCLLQPQRDTLRCGPAPPSRRSAGSPRHLERDGPYRSGAVTIREGAARKASSSERRPSELKIERGSYASGSPSARAAHASLLASLRRPRLGRRTRAAAPAALETKLAQLRRPRRGLNQRAPRPRHLKLNSMPPGRKPEPIATAAAIAAIVEETHEGVPAHPPGVGRAPAATRGPRRWYRVLVRTGRTFEVHRAEALAPLVRKPVC